MFRSSTPPSSHKSPNLRAGVLALALGSLLGLVSPRALLAQGAAPAAQKKITVEGVLEVLHEDREQGSRYHYFLNTAQGKVKLQMPAHKHAAGKGHSHEDEHQTGDRVRVRGTQLGQTLALDSGSDSMQPLANISANTFGAQSTLVILVNFQDNPVQPYTTAVAQDVVFNQTSQFHYENSYHQTWLTGAVRGWYTIAANSADCDINAIYSLARQAAQADGVNLANYSRFIYAFPQSSGCGWWGLGTVGGNPSHAWINGDLQLRVVAHETGHNLGLYHSHSLECGSVTIGGSCSSIEYGDTVDVMGTSSGHINAFQKEWLGWLNYGSSPPIVTAVESGVYTLDAYETAASNPKAVKILKSTDPTTGYRDWYYVEYRQAVGFDSYLSGNTNVVNGVVIHTGSESSMNSSNLLDLTPATSSWNDPALGVGQSFQDPDSGVTLTLLSADTAGATISVTYGATQCAPANPAVALSAQGQAVAAGTTLTYTVTITNRDTACGTSTFDLQTAAPNGWAATLDSDTVELASGASASLSLLVKSAGAAANGSYSIGLTAVNAADAGFSGAGSTAYAVGAPAGSSVNVAVSTSSTIYARKKPIGISAKVTSGVSPMKNAVVIFTITKPDGSVVSGSGKTKKNGLAALKFKTTLLDPVGTYWVTANSGTPGPLAALVTTSFIVQ